MVMDLIIVSIGLTVLLTRDVYRYARRKYRKRKLKKKLAAAEQGLEYTWDPAFDAAYLTLDDEEVVPGTSGGANRRTRRPRLNERGRGVPIPAPRTSRNHPDRPAVLRRGREINPEQSEEMWREQTPPPAYSPPSTISRASTEVWDSSVDSGSVASSSAATTPATRSLTVDLHGGMFPPPDELPPSFEVATAPGQKSGIEENEGTGSTDNEHDSMVIARRGTIRGPIGRADPITVTA